VWGIPPDNYYKAVAFASGFSSVWNVDIVDPDDCTVDIFAYVLMSNHFSTDMKKAVKELKILNMVSCFGHK
jgi:hypothetical protein